jgi:hypothetical protein
MDRLSRGADNLNSYMLLKYITFIFLSSHATEVLAL